LISVKVKESATASEIAHRIRSSGKNKSPTFLSLQTEYLIPQFRQNFIGIDVGITDGRDL
jgi:hypothetical protein